MAKKVTRTVEKKKEDGVKSKKVTYKTKSGTTVTRTKSKGGGTGKRKSTTVTNKAGNTVATSAKAKRQGGLSPKQKKKTVTSGNTTVTTRKQTGAYGKRTSRTVNKSGKEVAKKEKSMRRSGERLASGAVLGGFGTAAGLAGGPFGYSGAAMALGSQKALNYEMGKTKTKNGKVVKEKKQGAPNYSFRDVPLPKSNF